MRILLGIVVSLVAMALVGCSDTIVPQKWADLKITDSGRVQIEPDTDENGFYVEYRGISRERLLESVTQSLVKAGYKRVGVEFDGTVLGFEKDDDRLAVKVDQFGDMLYLAIFNEKGKEPLLHGVLFGKYTLGPPISGDSAKQMLRDELER